MLEHLPSHKLNHDLFILYEVSFWLCVSIQIVSIALSLVSLIFSFALPNTLKYIQQSFQFKYCNFSFYNFYLALFFLYNFHFFIEVPYRFPFFMFSIQSLNTFIIVFFHISFIFFIYLFLPFTKLQISQIFSLNALSLFEDWIFFKKAYHTVIIFHVPSVSSGLWQFVSLALFFFS